MLDNNLWTERYRPGSIDEYVWINDGQRQQVESWIKEDQEDKSTKYGYGELPVGTWFVSMKVKNDQIWNKVKEGQLNGFSVSGFFEEVAAFSKEEMFLYQVVEILKKY